MKNVSDSVVQGLGKETPVCVNCAFCTGERSETENLYSCQKGIRMKINPESAKKYTCKQWQSWKTAREDSGINDLLDKINETIKDDDGKYQMSFIPIDCLQKVARVYMMGAEKYGKGNWLKGMDWSRWYDAAQRHLMAFWDGHNVDNESGYHHLAHAVFNLFALMEYERLGLGTDDRTTDERTDS